MTFEITWVFGVFISIFVAVIGFFWRHIDARLENIEQHIDKSRIENGKLREELYRDFVRRSDMDALANDLRGIYERLNDMNERIVRISGRMHTRSEDD